MFKEAGCVLTNSVAKWSNDVLAPRVRDMDEVKIYL
jgi:hypothetical protein